MANSTLRFYLTIPMNDGTVVLACWRNTDYDPQRFPGEQLDKAMWVDPMPIMEALQLGSSLIVGGTDSMGQYSQRVRSIKLQQQVNGEIHKPADPIELARMSAFFEGVNLDPTASMPQVRDALLKHDQEPPGEVKESPQEA